jgi:hypothetical protein
VDQNSVQIWTTIITTVVQVITLIVVIIYTVYTAKMTSAARASAEAANNTIHEMEEARDQENAPHIVVYFDVPLGKHLIYLVVKNVGKGIATDVKLMFTTPLSSVIFKGINDVPLIKNGISSLPPNYEIRTLFDGVIQRFGNTNLPLTYTIEVSYWGGIINKRRTNVQVLDLSMYYGLMSVNEKGMNELAKAAEDIAKYMNNINSALKEISETLTNGIWIKNPLLTVATGNLYPVSWQANLAAKLKEFPNMWTLLYGKKDENLIDPFLSDLKNRFICLSEQIALLLTTSPSTVSEDLIDNIKGIIEKISDLGRKRFYIDGGKSVEEFNTLGDSIVQIIEDVLKQLANSSLSDSEEFD